MGLHVEHTNKQGYKNVRVVGRSYGVVHLAHDVGGALVVACQIAEQGASNGHVERGWNALACNIAYDEEQLIALDNEIVEVATNFLGGGHRGKEIEVWSLGERGGNHAHLYVVGNLELALKALFAGGGGLKVADVLLKRVEHVVEGVAKLQQLVFRLYLGQGSVHVALSNAYGRLGELAQRLDHVVDGPGAEHKQRSKAYDKHYGAILNNLVG